MYDIVHVFTCQEEYLRYFEWKNQYLFYYQNPYCTICQKLHNKNEPVKIYSDISDWYYFDKNGKKQCNDGSEREYYKSFIVQTDFDIIPDSLAKMYQ